MIFTIFFNREKENKLTISSTDEADTVNFDKSNWYMKMPYYSHYFCVYFQMSVIFVKPVALIQISEYGLDTTIGYRKERDLENV